MNPPAPPQLPAACADCIQTTLPALPGLNPEQLALQQFRSAEGKLRINFGTMSLIINPLTQLRILLNHPAFEARILSATPSLPGMPAIALPQFGLAMAGLPSMPGQPNIQQLGKMFIEGLEAEGLRYVFPVGGLISSWEVWTSTKLQLPVLTRTIGSFGQKTCTCKCTPVQPPAAMFEIPPGYTVIQPPAPPTPSVPAMPSIPQMPSAPQTPSLPSAPQMPSAPQTPSFPAIPNAPKLP